MFSKSLKPCKAILRFDFEKERESSTLVWTYCEISRDIKFFVNSRGEGIFKDFNMKTVRGEGVNCECEPHDPP